MSTQKKSPLDNVKDKRKFVDIMRQVSLVLTNGSNTTYHQAGTIECLLNTEATPPPGNDSSRESFHREGSERGNTANFRSCTRKTGQIRCEWPEKNCKRALWVHLSGSASMLCQTNATTPSGSTRESA